MAAQTKEAIVLRALRRAGLASSAMLLAPEPESMADALQDLEDMIAEWEGDGIVLSYRYSGAQSPQPSEESGLPDWAVSPVVHNLAVRLMIDNQRPIADEIHALAYNGLQMIRGRLVEVPELARRSDMPRGTGNGGRRYYYESDSALQDGNGKDFDF